MKRLRSAAIASTALAAAFLASSAPAQAQTATIVQNFTGITFNQSGGYVPPDTMGAMGDNNQYMEFVNDSVAVYNTATATSIVSPYSADTFWQNAGISSSVTGNGLSDPRVIFDKSSQRWFASQITTNPQSNAYLVAVSNTSNPTQGFKGYVFQANPSTGGSNLFADFDMLGVNGDNVTLTSNNFDANGSDNSSSILSISKADLLAESANPANKLFYANDPNGTGYLPHSVTDLDTNQGTGKSYFLSSYNSTNVALTSLTGSGANPSGQTLNTVSSGQQPGTAGFITIAANPEPPNASQPGASNSIQTNDSRFAGAVIKKDGYLWGVQETQQNNLAALHWEELDPTTLAVVHEGFIDDSTHDYYFGSIAVNDSGVVVIGYTRSGANEDPSTYASVGQISGSGITFGSPLSLKESTTPYSGFDGIPYRWGDYSNTVVDPTDPNKFWTIQEFSNTDNQWATQITGLEVGAAAPEPAQTAMLSIISIGLGGLLWRARKRRLATDEA